MFSQGYEWDNTDPPNGDGKRLWDAYQSLMQSLTQADQGGLYWQVSG